jgi:Swt1-like HEPN
MEWLPVQAGDERNFKIPERWLHIYYYEALNILFRFENALRLFVYVVLKRQLGKDWDLAALGDGITIRTETKKRIHQTREHGYLGYDVSSPMLFLNSGELTQIITSDGYWKYFAPFFRASKSIVITKLQEIGTVRNSLAHFRPIKQDDIDLIKQNSKHLLIEIEDCLVQLTSISDVVPTNSEDLWYKEIKPIGNNYWKTQLLVSRNQEWIRLQIGYNIPILEKSNSSRYPNYKVGTLRTSQILRLYPVVREACIYLSESMVYPKMGDDFTPSMSKGISIVFSKSTLESDFNGIVDALKAMALKVESETELIKQDGLARGELVEAKNISAALRDGVSGDGYWSFNTESLQTPVSDIDEVEYWGERWHFTTDFISSTSRYPWMPSSVSDDEFPF